MANELKLASVRFKETGKMYYFSTDLALKNGDSVVVETARGIEFGELIDDLRDIEDFKLNTELKKVVRKATKKDIEQYDRNKEEAIEALRICGEIIERHKLNMHLTNCEFTLDHSKVIFMYTADNRVDFRELLKELAVVFRCRIELRQIGPRDKAKIVGGIGVCGLPLCCTRIMGEFNGVSINMAKNQMLAINIDKISGNCGRLLCCLKYEDELYTEAKKKFPKIGTFVNYDNKSVKVIGYNVISDLIKIDNEGSIMFVNHDEIDVRRPSNSSNRKQNPANNKDSAPKNDENPRRSRRSRSKNKESGGEPSNQSAGDPAKKNKRRRSKKSSGRKPNPNRNQSSNKPNNGGKQ